MGEVVCRTVMHTLYSSINQSDLKWCSWFWTVLYHISLIKLNGNINGHTYLYCVYLVLILTQLPDCLMLIMYVPFVLTAINLVNYATRDYMNLLNVKE